MEMPGWMAKVMLRMGMLGEITVVGRKSGVERTAWINKKDAPGGGYHIAAGNEKDQRAKNLQAAGRCRLEVKGVENEYVATELVGDERTAALKGLAPPFAGDRMGITGPAFRLTNAA